MGRSEWAICVASNDDVNMVLKFVQDHNNSPDSGEELKLTCILRFENKIWACIVNHGGRDNTNDFLANYSFRNPTDRYYPFQKPEGWSDCRDYIWSQTDNTTPLIF